MKNLFTFIFLLFLTTNIIGQALPIAIDGRFDDWQDAQANYTDTSGDGNLIDLLDFSVSNDENFLFIRFSTEDEFLLNDNNQLFLEIDTDNDSYTGFYVNGIGAELGWSFGGRFGYFNLWENRNTIGFADIMYRSLPTVTAKEYEIAIGRDVKPDGIHPLFTSETIKICFKDFDVNGDLMPDVGEVFSYIFDNSPVPPYQPVDFEKADSMIIRLMTYNTLFDGLTDPERKESFKRIISAINPDIITFNECWDTQWWEARDFMNDILPLSGGVNWFSYKVVSGNITCSKYPIIDNVVVLSGHRIQASKIDLPDQFKKDIVVINSHFRCCEEDSIRQIEADATVKFILDEQTSSGVLDLENGTPIVISGDLNLVGNSQQLYTLLTGEIINTGMFGPGAPPDWDSSELEDNIALQTDIRMAYTWRSDYSSYWPGRLDFSIYTNNVAEVVKSYVVQTEIMTDERLNQYGLLKYDSRTASDHFAIVTDFRFIESQSIFDRTILDDEINIVKFKNALTIYLDLKKYSDVSFRIYDLHGREVLKNDPGKLNAGTHSLSINISGFVHGIYILVIEIQGRTSHRKIFL